MTTQKDTLIEQMRNLELVEGVDYYGALLDLCMDKAIEIVEESDYVFVSGEDMRPFTDVYKLRNKIAELKEKGERGMNDLYEREYRKGYSQGYNAGIIKGKGEFQDIKTHYKRRLSDALKWCPYLNKEDDAEIIKRTFED